MRLPRHTPLIRKALEINEPRLLIIDPITAFLDRRIITSSDHSIRRAITPLAVVFKRHACAGILVRHLNKSAGGKSMYRGSGTIGFNAACRSSWLFGADPQDPSRFIMAQIKNNLAERQPSLAYRVVPGAADNAPTIDWLGPSPLSGDQMLAGRGTTPKLLRDRAAQLLLDLLAPGPRPTRNMWAPPWK